MERSDQLTANEAELNRLKGFKLALDSSLERYVRINGERIDLFESIAQLDEIARSAALGALDNERLNDWMERYSALAENATLAPEVRRRVSGMLLEIQMALDSQRQELDDDVGALAVERVRNTFTRWRERSESVAEQTAEEKIAQTLSADRTVTPESTSQPEPAGTAESTQKRRVVLRRSSEDTSDLLGKFFERMWSQMEYLEYEMDAGRHALTTLDDLLNMAEAKSDGQYEHLAASLIYFLRQEGYKMTPYIQRLRRIQDRK